MTPSY